MIEQAWAKNQPATRGGNCATATLDEDEDEELSWIVSNCSVPEMIICQKCKCKELCFIYENCVQS